MDKYLINKDRLNMFNRIVDQTKNIEYSEELIRVFFDTIVPQIEQSINIPYATFKYLQNILIKDELREIIYDEILIYYNKDSEQYILFNDKINLEIFWELIYQEHERLFDKLGFGYDGTELSNLALQIIKEDLDCISSITEKRDHLLERKMEFSINLNSEVVNGIDKLLRILDEKTDSSVAYVDLERIRELQNIIQSNFDITKLVQFCEELNQAYEKNSYITIPLLIRAIIDHVPPIFGKTGFQEVTTQYGTKSFKESMSHLDKSLRKIADAIIHTQIRTKENLPSHAQIDFRADLDVLLAEVCRTLK